MIKRTFEATIRPLGRKTGGGITIPVQHLKEGTFKVLQRVKVTIEEIEPLTFEEKNKK